jgi:hypothetical protein
VKPKDVWRFGSGLTPDSQLGDARIDHDKRTPTLMNQTDAARQLAKGERGLADLTVENPGLFHGITKGEGHRQLIADWAG